MLIIITSANVFKLVERLSGNPSMGRSGVTFKFIMVLAVLGNTDKWPEPGGIILGLQEQFLVIGVFTKNLVS
jgi:hypothetical protein